MIKELIFIDPKYKEKRFPGLLLFSHEDYEAEQHFSDPGVTGLTKACHGLWQNLVFCGQDSGMVSSLRQDSTWNPTVLSQQN